MINQEKILFVKGFLLANGVTNPQLQEDLLDHFCCVIEENIESGKSFEESFGDAIQRITPNGPEEVQKDLNYLLTIKKIIMLRKLVFIASYLSVLTILLGVALRIPQILSGNAALLLIMVGILLFSVTTVPYFFYDRYQKSIGALRNE